MFAVLLMVVLLVFVIAECLIKTNKKGVAKGDFLFDRLEDFLFGMFLPGCLIALFTIEAIYDTLGVREAVSSYAYWLVGGFVLVVSTVLLYQLLRLRR